MCSQSSGSRRYLGPQTTQRRPMEDKSRIAKKRVTLCLAGQASSNNGASPLQPGSIVSMLKRLVTDQYLPLALIFGMSVG